jgi:hypothetical protein
MTSPEGRRAAARAFAIVSRSDVRRAHRSAKRRSSTLSAQAGSLIAVCVRVPTSRTSSSVWALRTRSRKAAGARPPIRSRCVGSQNYQNPPGLTIEAGALLPPRSSCSGYRSGDHRRDRLGKDLDVEPQRPRVDVVEVVLDPAVEVRLAATPHLPQSDADGHAFRLDRAPGPGGLEPVLAGLLATMAP